MPPYEELCPCGPPGWDWIAMIAGALMGAAFVLGVFRALCVTCEERMKR